MFGSAFEIENVFKWTELMFSDWELSGVTSICPSLFQSCSIKMLLKFCCLDAIEENKNANWISAIIENRDEKLYFKFNKGATPMAQWGDSEEVRISVWKTEIWGE